MNNCYSSLGSINGNPKKQNCGDGRCDPPDRGIDPNPKHRDLFLQIYRPGPSNGAGFGSFAREAVLRPSLTMPEFNQEGLLESAGGIFGFGAPGSSQTATGGAMPTEERAKFYIDDFKSWVATGLGLNENLVPILNSREALALMGSTMAGGLIASQTSMSLQSLITVPNFTLWENGGLTFWPSSPDNVYGGLRVMFRGTIAKMRFNSKSIFVYQERGGYTYFGEEFEIEDYHVYSPVLSVTQENKTKIVFIPYVTTEYTHLINGRSSIVFTAGAEAYSYRGFGTTTLDASLEYKIWNSCAQRLVGREANLTVGVYVNHSRQILGSSSVLTGEGSGGGGGGSILNRPSSSLWLGFYLSF